MASTVKIGSRQFGSNIEAYRYIRSNIVDFSIPTHNELLMLSPNRNRRIQLKLKRTFDFTFAIVSLIFLSPVFFLISLGIKLSSEGPVFFKQKRIGQVRLKKQMKFDGTVLKGESFYIYKFRTMTVDTPIYAVSPKNSEDKRITKIGKVLRKTCADELPQLINVLKGNMSLVGPRPEMPFIVEKYDHLQARRLWAKPGVTGLWQLQGSREKPIHEDLKFDMFYVKNWSLWLDYRILVQTLKFMIRGKNI
jgi:lipopolysaccharide/colanic/teichoic acid biosynthesis glycosyltransferase